MDCAIQYMAIIMIPTKETYLELELAFDFFNQHLFQGKLPPCLITLQREKSTFGYFSRNRFVNRENKQMVDEIAMNPAYFSIRTVKATLSTLVHEMVHMWQFHFGESGRRGYHNKQWGDKMETIGLMPSNTGKVGGKRVGDQMSHYIIPAGPFDKKCDQILTNKFTLSWLDRFPPYMPSTIHTTTVNVSVDVTSCEPGKKEDNIDIDEGEGENDVTLDEVSLASALVVAPPPVKVNKTNRSKYRCKSCETQVWGKPGLSIICGEEGCKKSCYVEIIE